MTAVQERSTGEKVLWWTQIGGVIAGVLGMLRHCAELAVVGAATAAAAFGLEGVLYRRNQTAQTT